MVSSAVPLPCLCPIFSLAGLISSNCSKCQLHAGSYPMSMSPTPVSPQLQSHCLLNVSLWFPRDAAKTQSTHINTKFSFSNPFFLWTGVPRLFEYHTRSFICNFSLFVIPHTQLPSHILSYISNVFPSPLPLPWYPLSLFLSWIISEVSSPLFPTPVLLL